MSKVESGKTAVVHYVGTLDDGTEFDNSREREDPLIFQIGAGDIIAGFEEAVLDMEVGQTKDIRLDPEEAYGNIREEAFHTVPQDSFGEEAEFQLGQLVYATTETGEELHARVTAIADSMVTLDFNHPMAGKSLNFEIELMSVE